MSWTEAVLTGERIKGNSYVGRGIVTGLSADGRYAAAAYFIMGRSENSRNRIFIPDGGDLKILPYDESKVKDPSLIIYYPVRECGDRLIVTNGDQTDTILGFLKAGGTFEQALEARTFEPDAPNFTPRISALLDFSGGSFGYRMSILKCADGKGGACSRFTFAYTPVAGTGHFIHTYVTDGDPLPSFEGEPEKVLIPDDPDVMAGDLWENLDEDNKISLYVRYTDLSDFSTRTRIINKRG